MKKLFILTVISFVSVIGNAQIVKAELTATGLTCSPNGVVFKFEYLFFNVFK
jgi:hypothetical protein